MSRPRGSISATIALRGEELHRVDVPGGALPSESLAALKASIGSFLTEYMQKNSIACIGEEDDVLEEIISSDDDEGGEASEKNKEKAEAQPRQRTTRGTKKRARVERARAKAEAVVGKSR